MRLRSGSPGASRGAVAALAIVLLLAACPRSAPRPTPSVSRSPTVAPRSGGELVVAYPHEPSTLNPFLPGGEAPATRDLVRPLLPSLYRIGPGGERLPSLLAAEPTEFTQQEEDKTIFGVRLRIRGDAMWSDGRPITTEDLHFTWQMIMDKRWAVASRDGYDRIANVVIEDATEARLLFERPFNGWRDLFSAGLGILPKHVLEGKRLDRSFVGAWPVSGGPFLLKTWTRGLEMVYERNPRAWEAVPSLDRIRVRFVPDAVTALQLFERKEVDVLGPYPSIDFARRAGAVPRSTVTTDTGSTWAALVLNTRDAVLRDVRVRRALAYALDRTAIGTGLVRGEGAVLDALSAGTELPPSGAFGRYRPGLGDPPKTAQAAALLDRAGWRDTGARFRSKGGATLTFTVAVVGADDLPGRVLRAMHAQAEQAGFDLNVVNLDHDRLWGDWLRSPRFEAAFLIVRDPPGGALRSRFASAMRPPNGENLSGLADATLDRLLDGAETVAEVHDRLAVLVPAIPVYRAVVSLIAGPNARGTEANASADGFLWNAAEWSRMGIARST